MNTDDRNSSTETPIKPSDLRGILQYVPLFRDHTFVISVDGSIVADDNFANVLTDIAVLRSLNIRLLLVHGVGRQIKELSQARGTAITDAYGNGPTDAATLALATEAAAMVSHQIIQGLTRNSLACAVTNAARATETGVLKSVDQGHSGKIDKIDLGMIGSLLEHGLIPLFSPIVFDREGNPLRINSDHLACELAIQLGASKLIYLTPHPGLLLDGRVVMNIPLEALVAKLRQNPDEIDPRLRSKARYAAHGLEAGVPRAHILDGRVFGGLLTEIFDKVGLGTMIHANEYQRIRPARRKDVPAIFNIIRNAARSEALRHRSRQSVDKNIDHFFVYEVDDSLIGCAALIPDDDGRCAELASVLVQPFYQGKGVGKKLVDYALDLARARGFEYILALSTQAAGFFRNVCGFADAAEQDLPPPRRQEYALSKRQSRIFIKRIAAA